MANEAETKPGKVRFAYQKARHHRTLHADGAWAGVTPLLEVQFALFNNLRTMPNEVTHLVTDEGGVGEEVSSDTPQSVLREVDITIVVSKDTAKALITVLGQMVKQIEDHIKSVGAKSVEAKSEHPASEIPKVS
jgi:hypothetical protein